ncbi:unnamed protein product, partial [Onchocerca flexuosa]|uniref:Uncharacterized protein n=1 Tax=Onchocerca flexuosa TaxID=387005 RepID=A0A183HB92_9BILA
MQWSIFIETINVSSNHTATDNVNHRERSCGWRSLNDYERPSSVADVTWLSRSRSEVTSRERITLFRFI